MSDSDNKPLPAESDKREVTAANWAPFDTLRHEIDRLFEDFRPFGRRWPATRSAFELDLPGFKAGWNVAPAMDLIEKEKEFEISAELPGLDEENVEVKVSNGILTIKGDKKEQKEEKRKDYYLSERRFGSFQRSIRVPDGVDADGIEAHFEKGLLTVVLPKNAQAQKAEKKISVKAK